ncbi:lysophospholipase [Ohessyouella blattaphilus]|uniref:Lysophospholipase n=1 Tax=Ohessyouella blattaphilus TaxID=2949333 RepID=A0ABT1EKH1_9FIRM|nr:lysophospholipase [Ohessyouella blattaphilus]MCP1111203.1 lysophospholipase [Ohessyouella blattaphilus]MCR8564597.1 lysophospholipase [Ohessyouella blattaphilus]
MKQEFTFSSRDGRTALHGIEWTPDGEIKGVVQIIHGMVEYVDRYDRFAKFLAKRGYVVVGHDLLGHGQSVVSEEDLGYLAPKKGNAILLSDIRRLWRMTKDKYPERPYVMLGHSLGSFLLRQYVQSYGSELAGVIYSGPGEYGFVSLLAGRLLAGVLIKRGGGHYRSEKLNQLGLGRFNKDFEPAKTPYEWICSDKLERNKYVGDPLTTFTMTVNGYYHIFDGFIKEKSVAGRKRIPGDLSVLMLSGLEDPVGAYGEGVAKIGKTYENLGITDVEKRLYEKERHEILNGVKWKEVYQDIYLWLEKKTRQGR